MYWIQDNSIHKIVRNYMASARRKRISKEEDENRKFTRLL